MYSKCPEFSRDTISAYKGLQENKLFTLNGLTINSMNLMKTDANKNKNLVYCIGSESLKTELVKGGYKLIEESRDYDVAIVVVGVDSKMTYTDMTLACHYIKSGAAYLLTSDKELSNGMPSPASIAAAIDQNIGIGGAKKKQIVDIDK